MPNADASQVAIHSSQGKQWEYLFIHATVLPMKRGLCLILWEKVFFPFYRRVVGKTVKPNS